MRSTLLLSVATITFLASCQSNAGTGALIGAGAGMGAGALISPTPAGVLIGGAVGAAGGAAIGAAIDASDRKQIEQQSPQTMNRIDRGEQLSINDIKKMSQAGITDDKIIGTIHSTGSVYHLTTSDIQDLKAAGVSQRVIDYMLKTAYQ
jgi:hypothetical protein